MKKIFRFLATVLIMVIMGCSGGSDNAPTPKSSEKAITEFSINGVVGTINENEKTIAVTMHFGTDVTNLYASFTTTGASVKVGSTEQLINGIGGGNNDFTYPVVYTVTAADGTSVTYTVTVKIPYKFVTTWGILGTGNGQFYNPQSVALDAYGNVYVADENNKRIQKFSSLGIYITQWETKWVFGPGTDMAYGPGIIAVDASGNVYVLSAGMQKYSSSGTYITQWGTLGFSMAVDASGNVYVVERGNNRIQKYSSSGTYITTWGTLGTGNGQFYNPQSIAVDASGNVYVVDGGNKRIQKFSSSGTYITEWEWDASESEDGKLNNPNYITVDASGNIYVVDGGDTIKIFSSSWIYITSIGSSGTTGTGNGQFNGISGVDVDASGNLYITDSGNNRIQLLSPQ